MFLLSLFTFLYGLLCVLIVFMVLLQRGKSNLGFGNMGGGNQALFGSSGGQDIYQKITWIFCAILLGGSLVLSIVKGKSGVSSVRYHQSHRSFPVDQNPLADDLL